MSQTLVNNYCRGTTAPGYDFFLKLAGLGVDLNWLLTGREAVGAGSTVAPEIPEKILFLISEISGDEEGMAGLEGMIEGYVKARRKAGKSRPKRKSERRMD